MRNYLKSTWSKMTTLKLKTSGTVSNVHLDFDSKKTSTPGKTACSERDKPCSLNRRAKGANTKSESKSCHSSKSKNAFSIHSKTSLSKSSLSKSQSNSGSSSSSKYSNAYYLSLNERRKNSEHAQLVAKQAEELAKRQLKLLEKSFELEKQSRTEEVLIACEDESSSIITLMKPYHIIQKKVMQFLNRKLGWG